MMTRKPDRGDLVMGSPGNHKFGSSGALKPRLVLGLDPGFTSLGFAVVALGKTPEEDRVVTLGVVRTKASDKKQRVLVADDNIRRCRELSRPVRGLIAFGNSAGGTEHETRGVQALFEAAPVLLVAAEKMSFPRNSSAAAKVAMTWGLIVANLERRGLPLLQASPQEVKRRVTGKADASKEAVEAAMIKRFGRGLLRMLKSLPEGQHEHAFDALAVVVACLDSEEGRMARMLG